MLEDNPTVRSSLPPDVQTAVTVGTFDGLHKGHLRILEELIDVARSQNLRSLVATFEPHPRQVLQPGNKLKILTTKEKKVSLLAELGLDYVVMLSFDRAFSRVSPERFVKDYLLRRYHMRSLVIGYDHTFGENRSGGEKTLSELSAVYEFSLIKVPPVIIEGQPVSSSRIRTALDNGDMLLAANLLGRYYSFIGKVVPGSGRGKKLGHPTANLQPLSKHKQLFPEGIYAAVVDLDGSLRRGVLHHGPRPTFDEPEPTLELNLFDFSGELYGRLLEVSILQRIRPILRFESAEELVRQMERDDQMVKEVFERIKIPVDTFSRVG